MEWGNLHILIMKAIKVMSKKISEAEEENIDIRLEKCLKVLIEKVKRMAKG